MPLGKVHSQAKQHIANSHPVLKEAIRIVAIVVGAALVAVGLEFFLVPNDFVDGGVTGVSIMLSDITNLPLGVFIATLNVPFILLAWKFSGTSEAIRTIIGIASLAGFALLWHHQEPWTEEFFLALGYGGALLGIGVGLALRYGGALDGIESIAHILSQRTKLDVDKIILFVNFFVFIVAGFVYSPEQAMASFLLFYIVVAPIIKRMLNTGTEVKTIQIISKQHAVIGEQIHQQFHIEVIYTDAHRDKLEDDLKIVTTFVSRIDEQGLTDMVEELDPEAIIIINDASSVRAGLFNQTH